MRTLWFLIFIIIAGALVAVMLTDAQSPRPSPVPLGQEMLATSENFNETPIDSSSKREPQTDPANGLSPSNPATEPDLTDKRTTESRGDSITLGMDRTIQSATVIGGNIQRVGPDELNVDDEFTLEGDGSKANPYRPSWEYLYSAGDTYAPRLGKNELPQRIALLDGSWIEISGYTVFPLVSGETSELLVMLNQWDGCCIGVPPTPFDAIEVGLTEAVRRGPRKHVLTYGTITGRLKVDPYLIEDWLVGLYLLEEASLEAGI